MADLLEAGSQPSEWIRNLTLVSALFLNLLSYLLPSELCARAEKSIRFDIAAQPLASALETYSVVTRTQVVYNAKLTNGRQAVAIEGVYTPGVALALLLQGSGLAPRYMAQDAVVLVPVPKTSLLVDAASAALAMRYYALIQARMLRALCVDGRARPENYRFALSFWIGPDGRLGRVVLLDTTGEAERDAAIEQVIGRVSIGEPPPTGFAQPVTLVISPATPSEQSECQSALVERPIRASR
jgi:hypothetical protein